MKVESRYGSFELSYALPQKADGTGLIAGVWKKFSILKGEGRFRSRCRRIDGSRGGFVEQMIELSKDRSIEFTPGEHFGQEELGTC